MMSEVLPWLPIPTGGTENTERQDMKPSALWEAILLSRRL
jgi:hypothetical protein